ncbi:MAG: S8 family serine peptidase, partial [Clostridia bacterium]|nr:S8 family serine peptidase [Clostridia bacterium]
MKNTVKRLISVLVAVLMVLSVSGSVFALETTEASKPLEAKTTASYDLSAIRNGNTFDIKAAEAEDIAADRIVTIMVQLADAPAMEKYSQYKAAVSYAESLREKQDVAVKNIRKALGVDVDVIYNYTLLFNGFSFKGEYRLVEELNKLEGVSAFVAAAWDVPEIRLFNSTDMVGAIAAWDLDYTGEGRIVAVVDTGMMVDHPAFSNDPDAETAHFAKSDIAAIIAQGQLQGTGTATMNADNVYYSGKVPFRWNYVHRDYDVAHRYNDHGTHVAGIAAGNGGEIQGVAKDAQIAAMQVFADSGGAGWEAILAALEDCVVLGVDAANLSLGSPCGFTEYYSPSYATTFENLVNAGVNLSMSAGNESNTGYNNAWGGYALPLNPDYGVVGSPSTWAKSLSIASVDNDKSQTYTIENAETGNLYSYTENADNDAKLDARYGGQTLDFVAVPGYGEMSDYEGINVEGKVAVVSRGSTTFVEKAQNAQANGAIVCIIYNNTDGSINMATDPSITIPFIFVLKDSGDEMAEQGEGQIIINTEQSIMDVPGGGQPSSFSSWGTTSDLKLKPEITAPGGNIYSSTDPRPSMSGAYYQAWSGTSMSAPHVSGGMAIVTSYVNEMFPDLSTAEKQNMVDTILMSTANPVEDKDGAFAAVRSQGAGLMDLADAVTTTSYITVPGSVRPKIELGDDPDYTGVFELTFNVVNFGDTDLSYVVEPFVLMDDLAAIAYGPDAEHPYVIGRT